ncbi:MAG: phage protease [Luteolibacter sp.]|jgi:phage I-like protein|nr:phage protease [Luteolibacter sp.]
MKSQLILAAFTSALASNGSEPPTEIIFIPEGQHQITATVDGKPGTITVNVPASKGAEITARLQAALAQRHAGNVRPHFAFQHQTGAASGIPQSFRYQPGTGIMCAVDWSGSGAAAIQNRDFSYFSPVFLMGDDGTPDSLPEKGELGSLVNEPAFRSMPRIAAADASGILPVGMPGSATEQIEARAQRMVSAGEAGDIDEAIGRVVASDPALYRVSCGEKIRPEIAAEIQEMLKAMEPTAREKLQAIADEIYLKGEAQSETDAMVKAVQMNPLLYQNKVDEQEEIARKAFTGKAAPSKSSPGKVAAGYFEARAQTLVSAGDAKDIDEAYGLVAAADPEAYSAYLKSLA